MLPECSFDCGLAMMPPAAQTRNAPPSVRERLAGGRARPAVSAGIVIMVWGIYFIFGPIPTHPNAPLLRAFLSLFDGIGVFLKG